MSDFSDLENLEDLEDLDVSIEEEEITIESTAEVIVADEDEEDEGSDSWTELSDVDPQTTALVIGDPHFKANNILQGREYIERCVTLAQKVNPTFIVVLGDVLDTHEVVRVQPLNLATKFIDRLSSVAKTFVLIGNHDLINQSQFLTDNHAFNALKKWPNVTIVDTPVSYSIDGHVFVFVPYVPKGRFMDALKTVDEEWPMAATIFSHSEFRGLKMGAIVSQDGDKWSKKYPPIINGHIHEEQIVGNVYCPGSSIQLAYGESGDKCVWEVTYSDDDESFEYKRHSLGLKEKRIIKHSLESLEKFDFGECQKYDIRINLTGTPSDFKLFRKTELHSKLLQHKVKISYNPQAVKNDKQTEGFSNISYSSILKNLVEKETVRVQKVYHEVIC